ncbi:hypothetical protein FACS189494_11420 [Spirochaetia bacterium]|nr:hypothetical protein FACS189494_11420 [Spirochaetia bacterium]
MKKLLSAILFVCVSLHLFAQNNALPRLAVVEFSVNLNTQKANTDAVTVRNITESQMIGTGKYDVITRNEIDKLLANQRIAVSSISSTENVKKLQLQNISYIVTGSVDAIGNDYAVTVKIFDVSTGQFSHSANDFMGGSSRELYTGVNTLISHFVSGMSSQGGQVAQSENSISVKTYKLGDTGPGGGIICLVEGNFYMEVSRLLGNYSWQEAISVAGNFNGGGFSDWHLPTRGELTLIYENIHKSKIVNLGSEWYWSSSEYKTDNAWVHGFSAGRQGYGYKIYTFCVRAVRAF